MFRRTVLWLVSFLSFQQLFGQEYKYLNLTTEDGLISNRVLELFQHENGDIWIGTADGISVFDGLEFNHITESNGLVSNIVYSIQSLPDNRMAIGTFGGLTILHGKKSRTLDTLSGLPSNLVHNLSYAQGKLWVHTAGGLVVFENDSIKPAPFGKLPTKDPVVDLAEDKWGRLWMSTGGNLSRTGSGVFVWDGKTLTNLTKANGVASGRVTRTFFRGDEIWVCAYSGVSVFNKDLDTIKVMRPYGIPKEFYAHALDVEGHLWSAGWDYAIYRPSASGFKQLVYDPKMFKDVKAMIGDTEGNIWCGSQEHGVTKISLKPFINVGINEGLSSSGVNRFAGISDSIVYVATDSGLDFINTETFEVRKPLIQNYKVRCVFPEGPNSIWAGLNDIEGLVLSEGGKTQFFSDGNPGAVHYVSDIIRANDTLFLATHLGPAFFDNAAIHYLSPQGMPKGTRHINQLFADPDGSIWLATNELGLLNYKNGKVKSIGVKDGLDATIIYQLYRDSKSRLWCLTNTGLFIKSGSKFSKVKTETFGNTAGGFRSIVEVNDTTFWLGMSRGVSRMIFKDDTLLSARNYGLEEGFTSMDCNQRAIFKDSRGRIWFGTNGGINVYHPEFDRINTKPPKIRFTEVLLFQTETDWSEFAEVTFDGLPIKPELPYDKNHISFRFKGVTHVNPEEVVYRYRLVGQTNDWIQTKDRKADYNNLPPGEYRFEVTCTNKDGFGTPEPLVLEFVIEPPFWQTWWFYLIIVLIISGGVYSYFQIRSANFKINQINQELNVQKEIISSKNKDIMDSIYYAKRIQDAVLPPTQVPDYPGTFVFFKPKDIVSGDFYWFYQMDGLWLFAAADCTGHGVPGAFMSIIGYNLLDKIVGEYNIYEPAKILDKLNDEISRTLHQKSTDKDQIRDGMDMALICFNKHTNTLEFAGAVNPLWLLRNGQIEIIKGDRMPIGTRDIYNRKYTNHVLTLQAGDQIYLYTDGITDQFGANGGGKFKARRLKELLESVSHLSPEAQRNAIESAFEKWKGEEEQLDDLLVIGSRLL